MNCRVANLVLFLLTVWPGGATESPGSARPASSAPTSAFSPGQVTETWGWYMAQEKKLAGIELNASELSAFFGGWDSAFTNSRTPDDLQSIYPNVERLAKARRQRAVRAVTARNEVEAKSFFNGLMKRSNVVELPGGVAYEIVRPGQGPVPRPEQTVIVHYTGHLIDGTEFVQFGPADVVLVTNRSVCRGWVQSLQKLSPGGKMKLYVPPPLSEEDAERMGIQPGSTMIFEIELLDVKNTSPEDLADSLTGLPPEPPIPVSRWTDLRLIETWGWIIAQETRAPQFGLSASELASLKKGLAMGIRDEPPACDLQKITPEVERFVNDHRERVRLATRRQRLAENEAFFAQLKRNTNVVESPSGLRYEILKPGVGPVPQPNQRVNVNYVGRLLNGSVFDQTDPSLGPLDIDLDKVIPGWTEGVQKIRRGGKVKLYIPPALGYGEVATAGIPANSALIFEIELLDIKEIPPTLALPGARPR